MGTLPAAQVRRERHPRGGLGTHAAACAMGHRDTGMLKPLTTLDFVVAAEYNILLGESTPKIQCCVSGFVLRLKRAIKDFGLTSGKLRF